MLMTHHHKLWQGMLLLFMMKICLAVLGSLEELKKYWLDEMDRSELPWCDCQLGKELFSGQFSCITNWKFMMRMIRPAHRGGLGGSNELPAQLGVPS